MPTARTQYSAGAKTLDAKKETTANKPPRLNRSRPSSCRKPQWDSKARSLVSGSCVGRRAWHRGAQVFRTLSLLLVVFGALLGRRRSIGVVVRFWVANLMPLHPQFSKLLHYMSRPHGAPDQEEEPKPHHDGKAPANGGKTFERLGVAIIAIHGETIKPIHVVQQELAQLIGHDKERSKDGHVEWAVFAPVRRLTAARFVSNVGHNDDHHEADNNKRDKVAHGAGGGGDGPTNESDHQRRPASCADDGRDGQH